MAVKGQSPAVVDEILFADRSILNERDKKENTALHIATRKSRPQVSLSLSVHIPHMMTADFYLSINCFALDETAILRY